MSNRAAVSEEEWLYRRSWPDKRYLNPDGTAHSRVFKLREKDEGELSVDVKSMITAEESVSDPNKFFLYEIDNDYVISIDLSTLHSPLEEGLNDAHAVIVGMDILDDVKPRQLADRSRRIFFQ